MKIGQTIRNAREDMDLTQQDMAERIPMNQSNYSKIERDLQEPNLEQLKRIVENLNLDLYALLDLHPTRENIDLRFAKEMKSLYRKYYK